MRKGEDDLHKEVSVQVIAVQGNTRCFLAEPEEDTRDVLLPCNSDWLPAGLHSHRERQEQLMGYRKRGPKPKHLLVQVREI